MFKDKSRKVCQQRYDQDQQRVSARLNSNGNNPYRSRKKDHGRRLKFRKLRLIQWTTTPIITIRCPTVLLSILAVERRSGDKLLPNDRLMLPLRYHLLVQAQHHSLSHHLLTKWLIYHSVMKSLARSLLLRRQVFRVRVRIRNPRRNNVLLLQASLEAPIRQIRGKKTWTGRTTNKQMRNSDLRLLQSTPSSTFTIQSLFLQCPQNRHDANHHRRLFPRCKVFP